MIKTTAELKAHKTEVEIKILLIELVRSMTQLHFQFLIKKIGMPEFKDITEAQIFLYARKILNTLEKEAHDRH